MALKGNFSLFSKKGWHFKKFVYQPNKLTFGLPLSFISKQQTPIRRVSSQLLFQGRRRFIYLNATSAYVFLLRRVFLEPQALFTHVKNTYSVDMFNEYLTQVFNDFSFRNVNVSLWSKARVFNIMFRVRSYKLYKVRVYKACYIKPNRRILLV